MLSTTCARQPRRLQVFQGQRVSSSTSTLPFKRSSLNVTAIRPVRPMIPVNKKRVLRRTKKMKGGKVKKETKPLRRSERSATFTILPQGETAGFWPTAKNRTAKRINIRKQAASFTRLYLTSGLSINKFHGDHRDSHDVIALIEMRESTPPLYVYIRLLA